MIRDGKRYNVDIDKDGNPLRIDPATGEVTQGFYTPVFPGDKITTPAQQEASKKYIESLKRAAGRRTANRDLGKKYFFIDGKQRFSDLKPQTATRLIYLQTYIDFTTQNGNRLKLTTKTDMCRSDLPKVLGLSYDAVAAFWAEVSPKYLTEDEDGLLFSSSDVFVRGAIDLGESYYRAYCNGVKKLYKDTPKSRHKHLGHIFQLLPYVNVEYNMLCYNPTENDLDEIELLTLNEFSDLVNKYDNGNLHKLLKIYNNLRFTVTDKNGDKHTERFISIVNNGIDRGKAKIFINPRILYSGCNYERVQVLGAFCKD